MARKREARLSIRLVWPIARLTAGKPGAAASLAHIGVRAAEFANPDTRISHRAAMELLEETVRLTADPALGLHAGEQIDPADFDVLERAARSAATLRDAIGCMGRYFRLMHEGFEMTLEGEGSNVAWCCRVTDGVPQPRAANDYVMAAAIGFSKRNTEWEPPTEVRFVHERPPYAGEYERIFQTKVRFGATCNAIVSRPARLDAPMLRASPRAAVAFEMHAEQLLARLRKTDGIAGRVREAIVSTLGKGEIGMEPVAAELAMSVSTLRRRLEAEDTTFARIVDDCRRELSQQYLQDPVHAIGEVAFLLGFSNVTAFHRAFKRWMGLSPAEYRASLRAAAKSARAREP